MRTGAEGWLITLDDGAERPWDDEGCRAVLSAEESRRADRLARPASAVTYVRVRSAVRGVLAQVLGESPADVRISSAPGGRPVLPEHPDWYVSWSTSAGMLLVGVCRGAPIGVDVELIRPVESPAKVLGTFYPSAFALGDFREPETFFSAWTLLEAAVKATGRGLARGARQVQLYRPPGARRCALAGIRDAGTVPWSGRTERFTLPRSPAQVMTAVVTRGTTTPVRLHHRQPPDTPPPSGDALRPLPETGAAS